LPPSSESECNLNKQSKHYYYYYIIILIDMIYKQIFIYLLKIFQIETLFEPLGPLFSRIFKNSNPLRIL